MILFIPFWYIVRQSGFLRNYTESNFVSVNATFFMTNQNAHFYISTWCIDKARIELLIQMLSFKKLVLIFNNL